MVSPSGVTVPPLRSGAKIGSLLTNFQAFCSYLFQYICNSLGTWRIVFVKQHLGGRRGAKMDSYTGKCCGKAAGTWTEEPENPARQWIHWAQGLWKRWTHGEKCPGAKRDTKNNSRVRKGSLPTRRSRHRKPVCPQQRTSRKDRRPEKKPMNRSRQIGSWTGIKTEAGNRTRRLQKDNAKVESSRLAEIHRLVRVCLGLV
ncbi:hypothetical protein OHD16_21735 [Sphingobacterium sp. ML3W]|uniref:hypothetical protein n=1 Tax=Sphingobacterium sp. ML3W TaxID=1538644 RepID=UPI00249B888B|nr:hypothetical protein [Sphingobacterium sp. ML3W]WFA77350.1 hypothetical protein OGI71_14875 [Sphingobacterium sp. ML3W]